MVSLMAVNILGRISNNFHSYRHIYCFVSHDTRWLPGRGDSCLVRAALMELSAFLEEPEQPASVHLHLSAISGSSIEQRRSPVGPAYQPDGWM